MSQAVPGRISSIVNIHNPSIEVHTVERGLNTGAAIILAAGGLAGMALLTRLGADTTKGRGAAFNRAAYIWKTCWRPYWKPRQKGDKQPRWTAQWTLWLAGHSAPPVTLCLTRDEVAAPRFPGI